MIMRAAADLHAKAALLMLEYGNHEGKYWLGTFAMYLLSNVSIFLGSSTVVLPRRCSKLVHSAVSVSDSPSIPAPLFSSSERYCSRPCLKTVEA